MSAFYCQEKVRRTLLRREGVHSCVYFEDTILEFADQQHSEARLSATRWVQFDNYVKAGKADDLVAKLILDSRLSSAAVARSA